MAEINSQPLNGQLNEAMSQVSNQCAAYIATSAVSASRRRLLQNADTARITAIIYYDPPQVRVHMAAGPVKGAGEQGGGGGPLPSGAVHRLPSSTGKRRQRACGA